LGLLRQFAHDGFAASASLISFGKAKLVRFVVLCFVNSPGNGGGRRSIEQRSQGLARRGTPRFDFVGKNWVRFAKVAAAYVIDIINPKRCSPAYPATAHRSLGSKSESIGLFISQ
jgi:hypothetical protein